MGGLVDVVDGSGEGCLADRSLESLEGGSGLPVTSVYQCVLIPGIVVVPHQHLSLQPLQIALKFSC